jgi:hypothetical protein
MCGSILMKEKQRTKKPAKRELIVVGAAFEL